MDNAVPEFVFAPEACHTPLLDGLPRALGLPAFREKPGAFATWRDSARTALRALVMGALDSAEDGPTDVRIEWEREETLPEGVAFREIRFVFSSEPNADVPCHLLLPVGSDRLPPVALCLQGHASGMHISLGRALREGDAAALGGDRDFALQAVQRGWAALAIEQRGFGEREPGTKALRYGSDPRCQHAAATALLLGRTLLGERCRDVSRAIDALTEAFADRVDVGRILCLGNSGGGTVTYYAACLDERIGAAMPSCSVCTFRHSIGRIGHCLDNYVPGIGPLFEMGDLAVLLAPRPLVVVTGRDDPIFPLAGVRETFDTIREIYGMQGDAPNACRLVIGEGGHRFYADDAWPVLGSLLPPAFRQH